MSLKSFRENALNSVVDVIKNKKPNMLTGEKNLTIAKEELRQKAKSINPVYLEVIEKESNIFVRQGLFVGYIKDGKILFDIPDWDRFISAVNAFYVACYMQNQNRG